jgi:predicted nucleic acid-binding protein
MVDTNVLFSALLFPSPNMTSIFDEIALNHKLVICSYVLEELHGATAEKFPDKVANVERLLSKMSYELVYTPKIIDESLFEIRDMDDYPVLYTAIMEDVDILICLHHFFSFFRCRSVCISLFRSSCLCYYLLL